MCHELLHGCVPAGRWMLRQVPANAVFDVAGDVYRFFAVELLQFAFDNLRGPS
jgi:hypothetical protein